jgi:group I intron endonuclease
MSEYLRKKRTVTIYQIFNRITNKCYIGSTLNSPLLRWKDHIKRLTFGYHNTKFQTAWNEYGITSWDFRIIEENIPEHLQFEKEQEWFDKFDCVYNGTDKIQRLHMKNNKITQVLLLIREGVTYREISKQTGMSLGYITKTNQKYELPN